MDNLEKFLLGTLRDAVQQVRMEVMEEMNVRNDQLLLNQKLGVKWNSPKGYKDAKTALVNFLNGNSSSTDAGYRFVKSIYSLFNELMPLFLMLRLEDLPDDTHEYLPEIEDLVERLRLLFFMQPVYTEGYHANALALNAPVVPNTSAQKTAHRSNTPDTSNYPGIEGLQNHLNKPT